MILALSADQPSMEPHWLRGGPIEVSMILIDLVPSVELVDVLTVILCRKFCALPSVCFPLSLFATTALYASDSRTVCVFALGCRSSADRILFAATAERGTWWPSMLLPSARLATQQTRYMSACCSICSRFCFVHLCFTMFSVVAGCADVSTDGFDRAGSKDFGGFDLLFFLAAFLRPASP